MKLHLGCGQRYFEGYVNIDFPPSSHTVQNNSVADIKTDLLSIQYGEESIKEVRSHHVFEHFTRPIACALVASWQSWLQPEGLLRIEVPDFVRMAKIILSPFKSIKSKSIAERHIFGSHEAHWAVHCDGYDKKSLPRLLETYGLVIEDTISTHWKGTYNIEVIARKEVKSLKKNDCLNLTKIYLSNYLVDNSNSEVRLLEEWMAIYSSQIIKSWEDN